MFIKQLEVDNFKSFANKVEIPMLEGFTTISGPNGSGKSTIIDSVLFALGLSTARTLRAEKLSHLISTYNKRNEAYVKVTFGGVDDGDFSVARKIRKSSQGQFNSVYYLNDKVVTLSEIHSKLEQYNITPNSYNVVMQGDVMSITNCTSGDRRKVVDEIAGVADFDRRIDQATGELKTVEQRVEAALLILSEVEKTLEQLKAEREVALKYKKLQEEKAGLEAQVGTVKFFDLRRNLELAHENILQSNKKLKEEQANKKDLDNIKGVIYIKDLLKYVGKALPKSLGAYALPICATISFTFGYFCSISIRSRIFCSSLSLSGLEMCKTTFQPYLSATFKCSCGKNSKIPAFAPTTPFLQLLL